MAEQKFVETLFTETASAKLHLTPVGAKATLCGKSLRGTRHTGDASYEMNICKYQDIAAAPARYCGRCSILAARQAGLS
jgi:hypothetical protein